MVPLSLLLLWNLVSRFDEFFFAILQSMPKKKLPLQFFLRLEHDNQLICSIFQLRLRFLLFNIESVMFISTFEINVYLDIYLVLSPYMLFQLTN